jgi:hypothetical protein
MKPQEPTKEIIQKAIRDSGFPFELRVIKKFVEMGFDTQPSYRFFDESKEKDVEIDLLATKREVFETKRGKKVLVIVNIAIECKDNLLPFVCFGMPYTKTTEPENVDTDSSYCHIITSRDDGLPNKFAYIVFEPANKDIYAKDHHHQFIDSLRFHRVTTLEQKGNRVKLHTPDSLNTTLAKLGAFVGDFDKFSAKKSAGKKRYLEDMQKMPVIMICFLALIHTGEQYRSIELNGKDDLQASTHTSVFLNRSYLDHSIRYIVDFVKFNELSQAVERIMDSREAMVKGIYPWLSAAV